MSARVLVAHLFAARLRYSAAIDQQHQQREAQMRRYSYQAVRNC